MRYLITQTIITNRIPIEEGDTRSFDTLREDYQNDPSSFPVDDTPLVEADHVVGLDEDEDD